MNPDGFRDDFSAEIFECHSKMRSSDIEATRSGTHRDTEISHRDISLPVGYRIPEIENMGATLDQFDTIDFSDNDIRKLEGFPFLKRIKSLLFNNNKIRSANLLIQCYARKVLSGRTGSSPITG